MDNNNENCVNNENNEDKEDKDNNEKDENKFSYYSRIIMMIILSIEFIFNIIFLSIINDINANVSVSPAVNENIFKMHKHAINTIFSFFFISYFAYFLELMALYGCFIKYYCHKILEIIFKNLNHLIMLVSFFICQFLFLIQCVIIPVYSQRVKNLVYEEYYVEEAKINIKNKYKAMEAISYIFLVLIIFLDFIVINLYKGICCQMEDICTQTKNCFKNFGRWFVDKLAFICCIKTTIREIEELENKKKAKEGQISNLSGDIKNLMAENLKLNIRVLNS